MASYDGSIRINTELLTNGFNKSLAGMGKSIKESISGLNRSLAGIGRSITGSIGHMERGIASLKNSVSGLLGSLGLGLGIAGLVALGKQAIDTASGIQEVQNVVDTAFGSMSYKMEEFAKTAVKQFGLSQLSAKQMGSTFMSLGATMVGSMEQASDMAIALTARSADMASFFNKSADETATALESIYTGETEALKEYGVVMTEVNLQEFAHQQGIKKKISAMTQAEKVQLRYMYVMKQTALAEGDFAKTSGSWANQTRILAEQFKELLSVLGSGLITVLTPVVQFLNTILGQLITMAKQIGEILLKLFGISVPVADASKNMGGMAGNAGDLSDSMDSASDSAGDLADGVKKAKKEAKKALAPFDKLNVLSKESKSDKDNGNGGIKIDIPTVDMAEAAETEGAIDKIKTEISSLYELGEMIGEKLIKAMESIPWDEVYSAADNFGTGLAEFLNGLISPELFGTLGKTIANSLNTALHFLNSFGETFDWKDFGKSMAEGINSFFKNFDWELAAETFNTLADGILDAAIEAVTGIDWVQVRDKIVEFINGLDFKGIFFRLGKLANALANALYTLVSDEKTWKSLGKKIADGINGFFKGMNKVDKKTGLTGWQALGKGITDAISGILTAITTALDGIKWEKVGQAIADFIKNIDVGKITWKLGKLVKSLATAFYTLVSDKKTWKLLGQKIADGINGFFKGMNEVDAKTGLTGFETLAKSFSSTISGIFTSISTTLKKTDWEEIGGSIVSFFANIDWVDILSSAADLIASLAKGIYELLKGALKKDVEYLKEYLPDWIKSIGTYAINLGVKIGEKAKDFAEKVKDFIKDLPENFISLALKIGTTLLEFNKKISDFLKNLPQIAFGIALKIASTISEISGKIGDFISKLPEKVFKFGLKILSKVPEVGKDIKEFLEKIPLKVFKFLLGIGSTKEDISRKLTSFLKSIPLKIFNIAVGIGTTIESFNKKIKSFISKTLKLGGVLVKLSAVLEVGAIKSAIKMIVKWINDYVIGAINKISVKIPKWVMGIGGKTFGFNVPKIPVPQLANGAVIRGGDPFMAVLGDQPRGQTNIEAPLATIEKALSNVMNKNGGMSGEVTVKVYLGEKDITKAVKTEADTYFKRTGKPLFGY